MHISIRHSLLVRLLSIYLLFVLTVLIGGAVVNSIVEQQLRSDAQASNQALAQEIALQTSLQLQSAESATVALSQMVAQTQNAREVAKLFQSFENARNDVDSVYWLNELGGIRLAWPLSSLNTATEFLPSDIVQRVLLSTGPVFEVGIANESTFNPGVIIAEPIHDAYGKLAGIVATSLTLVELSIPLSAVVHAQLEQGYHLDMSIIDGQGRLIASPHHNLLLDTVKDQLPGATDALNGKITSKLGTDSKGEEWLFSAVPVPNIGWAVIVQSPTNEALAAVDRLHDWLLIIAILFAAGGLLFWLLLFRRVIRPLHTLASQHQMMPASEESIPWETKIIANRNDEVGTLARSLLRLEFDGLTQLSELRTLLETSNTVVGSLDPHAVVGTIIHEVRRLVDVQAASVLVPDEHNILRVLVSEGHSERYEHTLLLEPENDTSSAVLALRNGKPEQRLLGDDRPSPGYDDGFRSVLAIPIISLHAGGVVLLVYRKEAQLFSQNEIDLLLTFANYATLAWEHAILYERSDERLQEIANENVKLYKQAAQEKQTLEAIMGSISDGLILTGSDSIVLYANRGACALLESEHAHIEGRSISEVYDILHTVASTEGAEALDRLATSTINEQTIELKRQQHRQMIRLRLFDVNDVSGRIIGRGMLLRDVTREYELDEFKTTLLAAVGHEVRTPLAAIKGNASTLLQEDIIWSAADQRHFIQTISNEADRLAQLISNLLDLSRQEAGLLLLRCEPTHISGIIAHILSSIDYSQVIITTEIENDLPMVSVDRARIEIVLYNLITNAIVYGDGEVKITVTRVFDGIAVAVSDNGQGITKDDLPYIFVRFYRTRQGRQRRSGGIGLGLAICKSFIEAHGGTIQAQSIGLGATISFTLPFVCPDDTHNTHTRRE